LELYMSTIDGTRSLGWQLPVNSTGNSPGERVTEHKATLGGEQVVINTRSLSHLTPALVRQLQRRPDGAPLPRDAWKQAKVTLNPALPPQLQKLLDTVTKER
jgi:hypothetical protein